MDTISGEISPSLLEMIQGESIMDDSRSDILSASDIISVMNLSQTSGIIGNTSGDLGDDQSSFEQSQTSLNALDQMTVLRDEVLGKTLIVEVIAIIANILFYLSLFVGMCEIIEII